MKPISKLFTVVSLVMAATATTALTSCNKDDVIEVNQNRPEIALDSETGVYAVRVGEQLTISPTYRNVGGATYRWSEEGATLSTRSELTYTWDEAGDHYITLTVTTDAGTATEEVKVEVVEPAPPVISLPIAGDVLTIKVGTDYVLSPEVSNSQLDDFTIRWFVDDRFVGDGMTYTFRATETGDFALRIEAKNSDGQDTRRITVHVVDQLPYTVEFPTPSYFQQSTTRYTFAGRGVYLRPLIENLTPTSYVWTVDGQRQDCDEAGLLFTPDAPGEYTVNVTINGEATASVKVVCVEATEAQRMRAASASSRSTSNKVYEYCPAPGQFINETKTGGFTGAEITHELACTWAQERLDKKAWVSLGGFGGYVIVGFDHSVKAGGADYDFAVMANAFSGKGQGNSNEPGIVWVMQDVNGNGLPDDEWYELVGSETGKSTTYQDYAVTYYRPAGNGMNVQWSDNRGATGTVDYLQSFHNQPTYYPAWVPADAYTLRGTRVVPQTAQDPTTGLWSNNPLGWGYADNLGSDNLGSSVNGEGQRNGFKIANAVMGNGQKIRLEYIDFIKVQTGVNSKAGWLGELSTEVVTFEDLD